MFFPTFDPIYLLFALPALILGLGATLFLNYSVKKYNQIETKRKLTGIEVAEQIGRSENIKFQINLLPDLLSESYDPSSHTLNLSIDSAHGRTITSTAITAHELGHIVQHQKNNFLFRIRTGIVPLVNFGTNFGYILLIIGFVLEFSSLAWLGVIFFSLATVFALVTVPLEFDASDRAIKILERNQLIFPSEKPAIKSVLVAASLTYVAGLFQSLGQLLYFVFRIQGLSRTREE